MTLSVSGFEFTCESGLFDLLDVALYHGWLVDPQDKETYRVIKDFSYNQLAEMVVNSSNSEETNELTNGELSALCLNDSIIYFSMLYCDYFVYKMHTLTQP